MADLHSFPAKRCWTVTGFVVHQSKILLVKHKKLGVWLAPGGHVEVDELPHEAAIREVWEETGIKAEILDVGSTLPTTVSENLPHPFLTNLHWVSEANYQARVNGVARDEKTIKNWGKGCEQHICFLYLARPSGSVEVQQNLEETDGIGWFTLEEVENLDTHSEVKHEAAKAFVLMQQLKESDE